MRKLLFAGLLSALCAIAALAQSVVSDDSVLDEARRKYAEDSSGATVEITVSGDLTITIPGDSALDGARAEYAASGDAARRTAAPPDAPVPAAPAAEAAPAEPALPFSPFSFTIIPGIGLFDGRVESALATGLVASSVYSVRGVQAAPVFCLAPGGVSGVEAAGVFSIAGNVAGIQAAGVFNIAGDILGGAQAAGIFNLAGKVSGVQIGLINVCDSLDGVAIGLFNFVKDGINEVGVFYDETGYGYAFTKFGTQHTYTLIYLGEPVSELFNPDDVTAGLGVGVRLGSMDRYLDIDASAKIYAGTLDFGPFLLHPVMPCPYTGSSRAFLSLRAAAGMKLFGHLDATVGFILETGVGSWSVVDPRYMGSSEFGFTLFGQPVQMYPKWFVSVAL